MRYNKAKCDGLHVWDEAISSTRTGWEKNSLRAVQQRRTWGS